MAADAEKVARGGLTKAALARALNWSLPKLDRAVEEPGFPIVQRGGRGHAWLFDLDDVLAHVAVRQVEKQREASAARAAKLQDDPREARLSVKAKRHELTARRLAERLVSREDCRKAVEAVADELIAWRVRLAQGLEQFDIPQGARDLFNQLVSDSSAKFVSAIEKAIGEPGDSAG